MQDKPIIRRDHDERVRITNLPHDRSDRLIAPIPRDVRHRLETPDADGDPDDRRDSTEEGVEWLGVRVVRKTRLGDLSDRVEAWD
jgi:hypothetical protein